MLEKSVFILYRLGLYTLKPSVERVMQAKNLGIVNPSIQESEPQVYEAIKFLAVEFIERCYEALKKSGYEATHLLATLNDIKADKIELSTIASIVNDLPINIRPFIDVDKLQPREGWVKKNEGLKRGGPCGHYL